jgi:DNA damage-binding protein 1
VQVIPIDEKGQLHEAFNMRIDELNVLDMKFLEGTLKPTLVVLYQDSKDARHIKTYEVNLKDKVQLSAATMADAPCCSISVS